MPDTDGPPLTTVPTDFPRILFSLTSWQLLTLAQRYEGARSYIQRFYYPERTKPHVIRDLRRETWSAQLIYETADEEACRANLQIEYMRYAMEAAPSGSDGPLFATISLNEWLTAATAYAKLRMALRDIDGGVADTMDEAKLIAQRALQSTPTSL